MLGWESLFGRGLAWQRGRGKTSHSTRPEPVWGHHSPYFVLTNPPTASRLVGVYPPWWEPGCPGYRGRGRHGSHGESSGGEYLYRYCGSCRRKARFLSFSHGSLIPCWHTGRCKKRGVAGERILWSRHRGRILPVDRGLTCPPPWLLVPTYLDEYLWCLIRPCRTVRLP